MPDATKTHTITLGKHSEDVTKDELASIQKVMGAAAFAQYEVKELQPVQPPNLPDKTAKSKDKDKDKE